MICCYCDKEMQGDECAACEAGDNADEALASRCADAHVAELKATREEYTAATLGSIDGFINDPGLSRIDRWSFQSLRDKIERKERQRAELRAMTVTYMPFPGEPAPFAAFVDYADGSGGFETGIANCPVCPEERKGEGGYLRTIRIRHKLHLGQAAKLIGVTVAQLSSAELGRGGLDPFDAAIAKLEQ